MKIYNHILQGHEATLENAQDHARGVDWMEVETHEQESKYLHSNYVDTINGIDIYYDYGADYYYFVENEY